MAGPGGLGDLDSKDWKNLQEIADNLEEAWRKGEAVDLTRFLPPPGVAARPTVLQELIKTDLECRWRRGQAVVLDYYLERFPDELGTTHSISPTLVYEEFRVRQLFGDRPPLQQYQTRFPKQFNEVQELVQQHSVKTNVPQHTPPPGKRDSQDYVRTNVSQPAPSSVPSGSAASASFGKNVVVPQIGGMALIERIGTGSFAEVWKAKAPGGIFKALKIIIRPIDQEECQREVESMEHIKNLRHHFLLPIHQFWALEDRLMIMMDLADGSLRDCLNKHRKEGRKCVPLSDLLRYFRQAAEALDYLHSKKVQHRDIKPENILLVEDNVRVADFGLAKVQATTRMVTGTFAGTPLYMPPETWNDKSHPNGDQYSLAATYFELRAGRRLYKDGGLPSLMQSHLLETPNLDPLEEAEQKVLLKALAKNPDDRYPSCMAWFADLEKAVAPAPPVVPLNPGETLSDAPMNTLQPGQARPQSWHRPESQTQLGPLATQPSVVREPSWAGRVLTFVTLMGLVAAVAWIVWGNRPVAGDFSLKPPTPKPICAGDTDTVRIVIKRDNFTEPVQLKFADDPDVTIEAETIAPDATSVPAKVTIADAAAAGVKIIKFEAFTNDRSLPGEIKLDIKPLATLPRAAPAGPFRPAAETAIVTCSTAGTVKKYYKHLECAVGKTPVRFVFIPRAGRPFYVMVDMVHNELFAAFVERHSAQVPGCVWTLGARREENSDADFFWTAPETLACLSSLATQPWTPHFPYVLWIDDPFSLPHPLDVGVRDGSLPVLRVDVVEAQRFSEWLGGILPSAEQWDYAAGREEPQRGAGPFLEGWSDGDIAVKRARVGPLPVGAATKDRSVFGCHDMSGNGQEWTRTYLADQPGEYRGDANRVPHQARMLLRGRDYAHVAPLTFDESNGWAVTYPFFAPVRNFAQRAMLPHIGFRVVLEVD